ncbi:hypothetical protein WA158_003121 [Blastocystis sp. Blastoise]
MKFLIELVFLFLVTAQAVSCTSSQIGATVTRTYKSSSSEERFELWEGNSNTGVLVLSHNGAGFEKFSIDGDNNGWSNGSTFVVKTTTGVTLTQGTLDRYTRQEYYFNANFLVNDSTTWKYSVESQLDASWTQPTFVDTLWTPLSSGSFPNPSSITRYYRTSITIPTDLTSYAIYELGVFTKEGVIIYVNGENIYSYNVQEPATSTSTAISIQENSLYRRVTGPITTSITNTATLVIAIEIHTSSTPIELDEFKAFFIFHYGECIRRTQDGIINSNHGTDNTNPMAQAFDDDIQTLWYYSNIPATLDYTFADDRKEWINAYEVTTGWQWNERRPNSWKIFGTNDNNNWTLLDYKTNVVFTGKRITRRFYLPTNTERFRTYRYEILTVVKNSDGEIAEFEWLACNKPIETPTLAYPESTYKFLKNINSIILEPTQNGFTDWSITPELSNGLSFDTNSGIISGTSNNDFTGTFSIKAKHYSNNIEQEFALTLVSYTCASPDIRFDIYRLIGQDSYDGWEKYNIVDSTNTIVFERELLASDYDSTYSIKDYFCMPSGLYTVNLFAHSSQGWSTASMIAIDFYQGDSAYTAIRTTLYLQQTLSFPIHLGFETSTDFRILTNAESIPENWTSPNFDDSNWDIFDPSNPPLASKQMWLYRQKFTITSLPEAQSFIYLLKVRDGSIVYIDGVEIQRVCMPLGNYDINTKATEGTNLSGNRELRRVSGVMSLLQPGSHVFAIVITSQGDYYEHTADLETSLHISTDSNVASRTYDAWTDQSSHAWNDSYGDKIIDFNYKTRWASYSTEGDRTQWAQIGFHKWRTETVNKYCIVNGWDAPQQDPKKWTLKGSINRDDWVDIDHQENVHFLSRSEKQCFYAPSNQYSYVAYRFYCEDNESSFADSARCVVAELEIYTVNINNLVILPLSYNIQTITSFVGTEFTTLIPTSEYYTNYSITPDLPEGLSISNSNGRITGTPTTTTSSLYTITATSIQGTVSTTTIQINVSICSLPSRLIHINFVQIEGDAYQNGFYISTSSGTLIASISSFVTWTLDMTYDYCLLPDSYQLVLTDTGNNGWDKGHVVITLDNDEVLYKTALQYGESPKVLNFNLASLISPETTEWSYSSIPQIDSQWLTNPSIYNTWSKSISGSFSNLSGTTQYYITSFNIVNKSNYASYEIQLMIKAGCILYLNGQEIQRLHMPSISDSTTIPSEQYTDATKWFVTGSVQFGNLVEGLNTLAVEIHNIDTIPETTFSCNFLLQLSGSYRLKDGVVSCNTWGYNENGYSEICPNSLDGDFKTKFFTNRCDVDGELIYMQYTFNNNRKEYINSYTFYRSSDNNRLINYISLSGSNDGTNWDKLHEQDNISFGSYNTIDGRKTYDFYTEKSYNMFRISVRHPSCGSGYEIAEIVLENKIITNYCAATDGFSNANIGQVIQKSCPSGYEGFIENTCTSNGWSNLNNQCTLSIPQSPIYSQTNYELYTCMCNKISSPTIIAAEYTLSIEPSLPEGLTFDTTTGSIRGTPVAVFDNTEYTITVTNSQGSSSSVISLLSKYHPSMGNSCTPLQITTYNPINGAQNVPYSSSISLSFAETIHLGTSGSATISCIGSTTCNPMTIDISQVTISSDNLTITIIPSQQLSAGSQLTLSLTNGFVINDCNTIYPGLLSGSYSFSTPNPDDLIINSKVPATASMNIPITGTIILVMSSPVIFGNQLPSLKSTNGIISIPQSDIHLDGMTITITYSNLLYGTLYSLIVPQNTFMDSIYNVGNKPLNENEYTFTTVYRPTLITYSPVNGSNDLSLNEIIKFTYDRAVVKGEGNIQINSANHNMNIDINDERITLSSDNLILTISLSYHVSDTYTITAPEGLVKSVEADISSLPITNYSFTIASPLIMTITPPMNSIDLGYTFDMVFTFNRQIASLDNTMLVLFVAGDFLSFVPVLDSNGLSAKISITTPLTPDTTYDIFVPPNIFTDTKDMLSEQLSFTYKTAAAPTLISSIPEDNASNIPLSQTYTFTFSTNIVLGTGSIIISSSLDDIISIDSTTTSSIVISGNTLTVTIPSTSSLSYGKTYTFYIPFGFITNTVGMQNTAITTTFSTPSIPIISNMVPSHNSIGILPSNIQISLTFSIPMQAATGTIQLVGENTINIPVPGSMVTINNNIVILNIASIVPGTYNLIIPANTFISTYNAPFAGMNSGDYTLSFSYPPDISKFVIEGNSVTNNILNTPVNAGDYITFNLRLKNSNNEFITNISNIVLGGVSINELQVTATFNSGNIITPIDIGSLSNEGTIPISFSVITSGTYILSIECQCGSVTSTPILHSPMNNIIVNPAVTDPSGIILTGTGIAGNIPQNTEVSILIATHDAYGNPTDVTNYATTLSISWLLPSGFLPIVSQSITRESFGNYKYIYTTPIIDGDIPSQTIRISMTYNSLNVPITNNIITITNQYYSICPHNCNMRTNLGQCTSSGCTCVSEQYHADAGCTSCPGTTINPLIECSNHGSCGANSFTKIAECTCDINYSSTTCASLDIISGENTNDAANDVTNVLLSKITIEGISEPLSETQIQYIKLAISQSIQIKCCYDMKVTVLSSSTSAFKASTYQSRTSVSIRINIPSTEAEQKNILLQNSYKDGSFLKTLQNQGMTEATGIIIDSDSISQGPVCNDLAQNGIETDIDCGGSICSPCSNGKKCIVDSDCESGRCDPETLTCLFVFPIWAIIVIVVVVVVIIIVIIIVAVCNGKKNNKKPKLAKVSKSSNTASKAVEQKQSDTKQPTEDTKQKI